MTNQNSRLTSSWMALIAARMVTEARKIGLVKGVAFICIQKKGFSGGEIRFAVVDGVFYRDSKEKKDPGSNYFGIVMEKLAAMMAYDAHSGEVSSGLRYGESPYRGGVREEIGNFVIFVGFSGGTQDQDVQIARLGMDMMMPD